MNCTQLLPLAWPDSTIDFGLATIMLIARQIWLKGFPWLRLVTNG
jgi:hypothetical protein